MSNIALVVKMLESNPTADKATLVEMVIAQLKVTKSNAQVYVYNAQKKLGKPTKTAKPAKASKSVKATRAEIVRKSDEEIARIKDERLAQMKSIGERRVKEQAEIDAKKEVMLSQIDTFMDDNKPYLDGLTSPTRKFFGLAE
jgi:hypothetical protein